MKNKKRWLRHFAKANVVTTLGQRWLRKAQKARDSVAPAVTKHQTYNWDGAKNVKKRHHWERHTRFLEPISY